MMLISEVKIVFGCKLHAYMLACLLAASIIYHPKINKPLNNFVVFKHKSASWARTCLSTSLPRNVRVLN